MHKRGMSPIIITVLIMLLSLGTVTVVWTAVRSTISSVDEGDQTQTCIGVTMTLESCEYTESSTRVRVGRGSGAGIITGLRFVFETDTGDVSQDMHAPLPDQLESFTYSFGSTEVRTPLKVDVAAMVNNRACAVTGSPRACVFVQEWDSLPVCGDGIDNDDDGWCDAQGGICTDGSRPGDPACGTNFDNPTEDLVGSTTCSNQADDDGDGLIDGYDDDCTSPYMDGEVPPAMTACSDGQDNDGDTFVDFPADVGCTSLSDNDETEDNMQLSWPPSSGQQKKWAYAWDPTTSTYDNIVNVYQLRDYNNVATAVDKTDNMPEGHRTILIRKVLYANDNVSYSREKGLPTIHADLDDGCKNSTGAFVEVFDDYLDQTLRFRCVWWDKGAAEVRSRMSTFFEQFKQNQGTVDLVILDTEQGLSHWKIAQDYPSPPYPGRYQNPLANHHWNAIENDPRYLSSGLHDDLVSAGYTPSDARLNNTVLFYGSRARPLSGVDNHLVWNALMEEREAAYYNTAIYEAVKENYPTIRLSDWKYFKWKEPYVFPSKSGFEDHAYGEGAIVGTHQSQEFYASLMDGIWDKDEGKGYFDATPFNGLRYDVNKIRAMNLASNSPIHAWIARRSWSGDSAFNYLIKNTDLYQELIFHLSLSGTDEFIYWNPGNTPADDSILNRTMGEADAVAQYEGGVPLIRGLLPWTDTFVVSGVAIGDKKIWRFTPQLGSGQTITDVTTNAGNIDGTADVVFTLASQTITFKNAVVYNYPGTVSNKGAWIVQDGDAPDPLVT